MAAVATVLAANLGALVPALSSRAASAGFLIVVYAVFATVNILGVERGSRVNTFLAVAKILPLVLLIAGGLFAIDAAHFAGTRHRRDARAMQRIGPDLAVGGHAHLRVGLTFDRQRLVKAEPRAALLSRLHERHIWPAPEQEFLTQIWQTRSAFPCAQRVSGLSHKTVDYAMEHDAVIELRSRQRPDPLDMRGRNLWIHLDDDAPARCIDVKRVFRIDLAPIGGVGRALRRSRLHEAAQGERHERRRYKTTYPLHQDTLNLALSRLSTS